MDIEISQLAILACASLFAGFIDSVVGGGGLIQVPAIFSILPREAPATLFGTNKIASVFGTANAAWRYTRRVQMPWGTTLPAALAAFVFSYLGAMSVAWLPRELLRPLILILLVVAAAYTFWRKDFGALHSPQHAGRREFIYALAVGGAIGFYDGFFETVNVKTLKIGLSFFSPEQEINDLRENDVPLDYLITPAEVLSFLGAASKSTK